MPTSTASLSTSSTSSRFTTRHPRCGTAFLLVVMVMAILVFSVVGKPSLVWLVLSRLVGIPIVAGLAYEVIRYAGRHQKGTFARIVSWPGLALQRLTTREPDTGRGGGGHRRAPGGAAGGSGR